MRSHFPKTVRDLDRKYILAKFEIRIHRINSEVLFHPEKLFKRLAVGRAEKPGGELAS